MEVSLQHADIPALHPVHAIPGHQAEVRRHHHCPKPQKFLVLLYNHCRVGRWDTGTQSGAPLFRICYQISSAFLIRDINFGFGS